MTITAVGNATAEATSLTMPAHQAGDLLLMLAGQVSNTTGITVPAGWSVASVRRANSMSSMLAYKIAASGAETSGTWTSAALLICQVYRHDAQYLAVQGTAQNGGNTISPSFSALTDPTTTTTTSANLPRASGDQWVIGGILVLNNNDTPETPPSGMTHRISKAGTSSGEVALHDTNGNVSSWPSTNITLGIGMLWHTHTVGLFANGATLASGSSLFVIEDD